MACICKKRFRENLCNPLLISPGGNIVLLASNSQSSCLGFWSVGTEEAITLSSQPIVIIPKVFLLLLLLLKQVLLCSPGRPGTCSVDKTGQIHIDLLISASWVRATVPAGKLRNCSTMVQSGHRRFPLSNDPSGSSLWTQLFLSHHSSSLNHGNH